MYAYMYTRKAEETAQLFAPKDTQINLITSIDASFGHCWGFKRFHVSSFTLSHSFAHHLRIYRSLHKP